MAASATVIANKFLELAEKEGKKLTNMQLQKLVYIAHGYCLGLLGRPLYSDTTKAWQWGPVVPPLYNRLRKYGNGLVADKIPVVHDAEDSPDDQEYEIISAVWKSYGDFSGPKLSALTHQPNTPWSIAWGKEKFGTIPDDLIKKYYLERVSSL